MEGASRAENLAETDFRKLADPAQIAEAHAVAARLAQVMRTRLTRRDLARRRGYRLDLRRTIHRNISHGGVPISLVRRQRKEKPLRLVILLDASGSMSMYTGVFLRFIHGVLDEFREAEAFLFHTRLVHVSDAMKERDAQRALDRLSLMAQGAGGGTQDRREPRDLQPLACGARHSFAHLRDDRLRRLRDRRRGAARPRDGGSSRSRCRRIVWLNPMMGWDGYAPEAAGIKAALPHVDLFAPAHTLEEPRRARTLSGEVVTEATMTAHVDVLDLVSRLKAAEEPFALATVVRTVSVTAAKAGAKAIIRPDGRIEAGWIGGGCARGATLKAAREALADGQSRLVSIQPEDLLDELGVKPGESRDGVKFAKNMCPSQGTMDIFVEPVLPRPALVVLGSSPVALALAEQARPLGYHVTLAAPLGEFAACPTRTRRRRLRARRSRRCARASSSSRRRARATRPR